MQVGVPDTSPSDAPKEGLLSMSAGDFVEVYGRQAYAASFDCVVTCFFLDCAHNIVDLIEVIYHVLKVDTFTFLSSTTTVSPWTVLTNPTVAFWLLNRSRTSTLIPSNPFNQDCIGFALKVRKNEQ